MTIFYTNTVLTRLRDALGKEPTKGLLKDYRGREITGAKLLEGIEAAATHLVDCGVVKGERVLFLAQPSIESIIYFFALSRAGACVVLADPEMGQANFSERVEYAQVRWMIQDTSLKTLERYPFIKPVLRLFSIWFPEYLPIPKERRITIKRLSDLNDSIGESTEEITEDSEEMAIIFTSGTTGKPKGVVHTYASLSAGLDLIIQGVPIGASDYIYASQLYFLLIGLNIPAKVYLPKGGVFRAKTFLATAVREHITSTFLLPYEGQKILSVCTDKKMKLPKSFRTVLFGSAPVTKGFLSRFQSICNEHIKVFGVYGATEMLIIAKVSMEEKLLYTGPGDLLGRPLDSVVVHLTDDNELISRGPQMYDRYLGGEKAEYFYSGDLGTVDQDGNVIMLGRKKDMMIRKGYNIYPGLFETTISQIQGVRECAMVGVYDEHVEDEKIVLFVVKDPTIDLTEVSLRRSLTSGTQSIDRQALPDRIVFIESLPYAGRSKKIDKTKLQMLATSL